MGCPSIPQGKRLQSDTITLIRDEPKNLTMQRNASWRIRSRIRAYRMAISNYKPCFKAGLGEIQMIESSGISGIFVRSFLLHRSQGMHNPSGLMHSSHV